MSNNSSSTPATVTKTAQPKKLDGPACAVCNREGAMWLLKVGDNTPVRVHRPCGNDAQKSAPKGVRVQVFASRALRDVWNRKNATRNFWEKQLAGFKPTEKS